jgi:pimeloyl-ACP methyl ester carboxylesterase
MLVAVDVQRRFREQGDYVTSAPSSGRFIETTKGKVYIQEKGPSTGPAVMLLHAAGGWSGTWFETADALSKLGYHTIAIDVPPLGYSERIPGADYTKAAQAQRVKEVLDNLKISKVTLVGHSFSSGVTMETVFLYPERIRSLVLVDSVLSLTSPTDKTGLGGIVGTLFDIKPVRFLFVESIVTQPVFTRKLLKTFVYDPADATDAWVELYQQPQRIKGVTAAVTEWIPSVVAPEYSLASQKELYKKLSIPTLVIWGEEDRTTPLAQGKILAGLIPGSELKIMPKVGHLPPLEDNAAFNTLLINFLTQK